MKNLFQLESSYIPAGDQPQAIAKLVEGINQNADHQTVLGVTGSGKTFTMAHVIAQTQRPALIMAPNKTLAAQLYEEFKRFFPHNAVEYFVSYYDYYQPEAYVPSSDTYIAKDAAINEQIEQMRLSATKSLLERPDTIVVSSVSSIYGLGDPEEFFKMVLHFKKGDKIGQRDLLRRLAELQYARNDTELKRATFRVRGETVDIFPADHEKYAVRVELFDGEIEKISIFDPLTGVQERYLTSYTLFPKSHYVTTRQRTLEAMETIKTELHTQLAYLRDNNKLVEAQRLEQRTQFDLEMMAEVGYCQGIENYSRHLTGRTPGSPPPTLFSYLPKNGLVIIDESHVTIPQIGGMFKADRSRKTTLVDFGFRLPSAMDNRPLSFEEWEDLPKNTVYVSATPGKYETAKTPPERVAELVVRPTGLIDPEIEIRPQGSQVDDLLSEANQRIAMGDRVLVTTLTKKMAENLTEYLAEHDIKVRYLHSDVDTLERVEILRDLRLGKFDVLVGINLLREGLDLPEVSLVAVFDADKEGFLRSEGALIQTIGRAARNVRGKAILYADKITRSMQAAIDETDRRREKQVQYNVDNNITPTSTVRHVSDFIDLPENETPQKGRKKPKNSVVDDILHLEPHQIAKRIEKMEKEMNQKAKNLEFEAAAQIRDDIEQIRHQWLTPSTKP